MVMTNEDGKSWEDLEKELRNDIINSSTIHFSITNDIIEDDNSIDSKNRFCNYLSDSPSHDTICLVTNHDDNIIGDEFIHQFFNDEKDEQAGIGLDSDEDREVIRSPFSLAMKLEPFQITKTGASNKHDVYLSPSPSRVLSMITTPVIGRQMNENANVDKNNHHVKFRNQQSDYYNQTLNFKSRRAETGVFVMNQRNTATSALTSTKNGFVPSVNIKELNSINARHKRQRIQMEPESRFDDRIVGRDIKAAINSEYGCRCTKTKCLKLYCDCFQAGKVCKSHCACSECKNTQEESGPNGLRTKVIRNILIRKPNAFHRRYPREETTVSCACKSSK
jgi:hypothetical protein